MDENKKIRVAVVGLGAQGLVTVKNLLEEGFDVTGFEKNNYVGGIWHYSAENRVSVLPTTVVNGSKERASYTDFPYPEDVDSYPTAAQVDQYLNDYCDHFHLRPHLRLSTTIEAVVRDDTHDKWIIRVKADRSSASEYISFHKLVIAIGPHNIPIEPTIPGRHLFKGEVIHSIAFKDRSRFKDKRVMVVGASNTAADTCTSLVGVASKVYFSHRNGALIVPRYLKDGTSLDHGANYRMQNTVNWLEQYIPNAVGRFMEFFVNRIIRDEFGQADPTWNLYPAPSMKHQVPTISDSLVPALRAGTVVSTAAPSRITSEYDVELTNGNIVQVDVIIFCTGYNPNFSILGRFDPTLTDDKMHDYYTPRLYQNIFSLEYPDSLAFVGIALVFIPAFLMTDLSSMALAQMWSTKSSSPSLPPPAEMHAWRLQHMKWVNSVRASHHAGKMIKFSLPDGPWLDWVQRTAGTNLQENLGWTSWKAWKFWWNDWRFCNLLSGGVFTPIFYRLFDSDRRKKWDGAREAIEKMNEKIKQDIEIRKRAAQNKSTEEVIIGGR